MACVAGCLGSLRRHRGSFSAQANGLRRHHLVVRERSALPPVLPVSYCGLGPQYAFLAADMSSEVSSAVAVPTAGIRGWFRSLVVLGVFGFVCLVGGELFARLDDWWFADVPFLSTPSYNDL